MSDFFDFSVYVDAALTDIKRWSNAFFSLRSVFFFFFLLVRLVLLTTSSTTRSSDSENNPRTPARSNRLLPPWFVQSNGQIGFGSVVEVHPDGGRSAFQDRIRELVEHIAPGVTEVGRSTYLPGVLSRINEHGSSLGLRTLVNAGPNGHTAFHFVHRSWLGPQLVEVALRARPTDDLTAARGRSALKNAGLDTVLGHSNGDGSTLPVPGTTRQTHKTLSANELDFSPLVQHNGHRFRPTLSMTRQTADVVEAATSTRERRAWQRSMLDTSEFNLRYSYEVTVTATPMDEVLAVAAGQLLAGTASRIGQYSGLNELATEAYQQAPRDPARVPARPVHLAAPPHAAGERQRRGNFGDPLQRVGDAQRGDAAAPPGHARALHRRPDTHPGPAAGRDRHRHGGPGRCPSGAERSAMAAPQALRGLRIRRGPATGRKRCGPSTRRWAVNARCPPPSRRRACSSASPSWRRPAASPCCPRPPPHRTWDSRARRARRSG